MPQLGYWSIRGLAAPIRSLLHYAGEEYEEILYHDSNVDSWFDKKFTLGLDFPNLPYYFDGNVKLSQSKTILRYVARKHKLDGSTEEEKNLVDLMSEECGDLRHGLAELVYNKEFANLKAKYLEDVKPKLKQFEEFIGDKPYFVGNNITYVDFMMYEPLDQLRVMEPKTLEPYPKLRAFLDRYENIPAIKSYMASDKYIKRPFNGSIAFFNN